MIVEADRQVLTAVVINLPGSRLQSLGRVTQTFRPDDLLALTKLVRVLAQMLVHDGCLSHERRKSLRELAAALDRVFDELGDEEIPF